MRSDFVSKSAASAGKVKRRSEKQRAGGEAARPWEAVARSVRSERSVRRGSPRPWAAARRR